MTTIPVDLRELLERAKNFAFQTQCYTLYEDIHKALLSEQPQAGAGQFNWLVGLIDEECRYWHSAGDEARRSVCANLLASAKAAPQPPARHDQGDEVRRLREALTTAANRLDRLTLEVPGGYWREQAAEWTMDTRAALAAQGEAE